MKLWGEEYVKLIGLTMGATMNKTRTLSQRRAEYALNAILKVKDKNIAEFKNFSSSVPSMILQNGFGQTMAFFLSKGKNHHNEMIKIIKGWLAIRFNSNGAQKDDDFIGTISKLDQFQYLSMQEETLKLLEWVKRYAHAFLSKPKSEEDS